MKTLIYLNDQIKDPIVTHITFPSGEKHIRIVGLTPKVEPIIFYNGVGNLMKLGMTVDICRRAGARYITLVIPFVPYARQDRIIVEGDPLSIKVFANFINSLDLDRVVMVDPHSDVTPALINNSVIIPQHEISYKAVSFLAQYGRRLITLVAPDLGATKKVKALQELLYKRTGLNFPIIQCDKVRDPETGKLTGFRILKGHPNNHYCLIVDDICDGGGTFLGLADLLTEHNSIGQSLYATHGIFSKGTSILKQKFEYLFSSNSFPTDSNVVTFEIGAYA